MKYVRIKVVNPENPGVKYHWAIPLGRKKLKILGTQNVYIKVNEKGKRNDGLMVFPPKNIVWEKPAILNKKHKMMIK